MQLQIVSNEPSNKHLQNKVQELERQLKDQNSPYRYVMTEQLNSSYHGSPDRPPIEIFQNQKDNGESIKGLLSELEHTIKQTDDYLHKPNFSRLESKDLEPMSKQNSDLKSVMHSGQKQEIANIKKQLDEARMKMVSKSHNIQTMKQKMQKFTGSHNDSPSV